MKHWQETGQILARLAELAEAGEPAALASVVEISGSTYRRPGARFLIESAGSTLGGVSGGCLEEDVRQNGLRVMDDGACRLLHYETGNDDDTIWGLGLGCDGAVDVFVQPTGNDEFVAAAAAVRELLAGDQPFSLVTVLSSAPDADGEGDAPPGPAAQGGASPGPADNLTGRILVINNDAFVTGGTGHDATDSALLTIAAGCLEAGSSETGTVGRLRVFIESLRPPSTLFVCGAGDDAMPMVRMASKVGFRVVVIDHRPGYLTEERFPTAHALLRADPDDGVGDRPIGADSFVVLKTHNLVRDKAWTQQFLVSPTTYIGLLGPRARCEEIAETVPESARGRLYGPVGLDLGAEGPEQVGLAVVSELLAVRAKRQPGHLRAREVPIHA